MKISIIVDTTPHEAINRKATERILVVKKELLERYAEHGPSRDLRRILDLFWSRPLSFVVKTANERFIFEEAGIGVNWHQCDGQDVPHVQIHYLGRPVSFRALSFFDDTGHSGLLGYD